jgi:hypothetical protein
MPHPPDNVVCRLVINAVTIRRGMDLTGRPPLRLKHRPGGGLRKPKLRRATAAIAAAAASIGPRTAG